MSGDFLPEYTFVPVGSGYRPAYRLFVGKPLHMVPGSTPCASPMQAVRAAKEYVRIKLNPEIRAEQAPSNHDPLGIAHWHDERAGRAANDQVQAFGAIYLKGRKIEVEMRRRRA